MASSFELGKFFPDSLGVKIPMYVSYSQDVRRPEYNPLSPDILLNDALDRLSGSRKDSLLEITDDVITRKSINFTNVRSEEHTSELQSLMRNSYAVFYLKKKKKHKDR